VGEFDAETRRALARDRERMLYFPSPETAVERISALLWERETATVDRRQVLEQEIGELESRIAELGGIMEALQARMKAGRSLSVRERPGGLLRH